MIRLENESVLPEWAVGYFAMEAQDKKSGDRVSLWYWSDKERDFYDALFKHSHIERLIPDEYCPKNIPEDFDYFESWVKIKK